MNKHCRFLVSILLGIGVSGALAQRAKTKDNVAELRRSLRGLEWESVDYDGLSMLERCRTLTLLDHSLNEIGAVAIAEADLMSQYLEQQGLGEEFASSEHAETAPKRTYEDGQKTAAALLQGPMADSRYATMYEASDESDLRAGLRLHESGSRRKWGKFSEPVRNVRGMTAFLKSKDKFQGYVAWSKAESDRRQHDHEQAMAQKRADSKARAEQTQEENAARNRELAQQRQQEEDSRLAQQAIYAQSASNEQGDVVEDYDDDDDWYPIRYYGRHRNPRVGHYHRNGANQARARERTNKRVNGWHGAGGAGRRGGGRR